MRLETNMIEIEAPRADGSENDRSRSRREGQRKA